MTQNNHLSPQDRAVLDRLWYEMRRLTCTYPVVSLHIKGLCQPNPGFGAYAAVLKFPDHIQKIADFEPEATNNLAELLAAMTALDALPSTHLVDIYTQSEWLVKCATGVYGIGCYLDLWALIRQHEADHLIEWHWVRDDPLVEEARRLAQSQLTLYAA